MYRGGDIKRPTRLPSVLVVRRRPAPGARGGGRAAARRSRPRGGCSPRRPRRRSAPPRTRRRGSPSSSGALVVRSESASTFASFHLRAPRAVSASAHRAARMPATLFAAIEAPCRSSSRRCPAPRGRRPRPGPRPRSPRPSRRAPRRSARRADGRGRAAGARAPRPRRRRCARLRRPRFASSQPSLEACPSCPRSRSPHAACRRASPARAWSRRSRRGSWRSRRSTRRSRRWPAGSWTACAGSARCSRSRPGT